MDLFLDTWLKKMNPNSSSDKQTNCLEVWWGFFSVLCSQWEQWSYHHLLENLQLHYQVSRHGFSVMLYTNCMLEQSNRPSSLTLFLRRRLPHGGECILPECLLQVSSNEIISMAQWAREIRQHAEWSHSQDWSNSAPWSTALSGSATLHHMWLIRIAILCSP